MALCVVQVLGIAVLARSGGARERGWRTGAAVIAASWFPLFTVPCLVYAIDPSLLPQGSDVRATAIVNLSLFALLLGMSVGRPHDDKAPGLITADANEPADRRLIAWFCIGLAALVGLMSANGGPAEFVSNLDRSGAMSAGLIYVVWLALAIRFAPVVRAGANWAQGRPIGRWTLAALIVGTVLIGLTGARAFVAVAGVQILLTYALLRRPVRLRVVAPAMVVLGILLVFAVGIVKRYQGYTHAVDPGIGFIDYVQERAGPELVESYVNNYVDTVRLIALAEDITPRRAPYEEGRLVLRLLAKPIPRSVRPDVPRNGTIEENFTPSGGYSYAVPLQAALYLAWGPGALVLGFLALGAAIRTLDVWLAAPRTRPLSHVLAAIACVVQVPVLLRSGVPEGLSFLLIEVVGVWAVAASSVTRRSRVAPREVSSTGSGRRAADSGA